ncbi:type IV secretion system protein [Moraxella sp. Tifton1]|uniref:type IV secretion system protein n=1 Tax=Moraxella oculi TaxID=2940516 RepID=UPI0020119D8D|nr:type IV secretion system protein [Moraxella sp. Tifton1]MCL1624202.1 type IV secretion system protein [Moraxella sp. Tifton1]
MKVNFSEKAKKAISAFALLTMIGSSNVAYSAGVPVFDGANVAQAISQVQNQIKQIENLRSQLKAVTGNARLGVLLNDPNVQKALGKYVPSGVSLSDLTSGNYDKVLAQVAKRIEADMQRQREATDPKAQLAQATLLNYAQVEQSLTDLATFSRSAQKIADQINLTTDASSKADLANTLMAQKTQIDLAIAQINIKMKQMEMLERQAREIATQSYGQKMFRR